MKFPRVLGVLTALLAGAPAISCAQLMYTAYTARDVNVRAGPAADFPVVRILPAGVAVIVDGCLSNYQWCDVVAGPDQGWVYAGNLVYPYQGQSVPVLNYGAVIGLGIVTFSVGNYWDNHYRGRPWYSQRQEWIDRPRTGYRGESRRPPPQAPVARPGNQRPLQGQASGGGQRPLQGQAPGGSRRPPQGQAPGGSQRLPQDLTPNGRRPRDDPAPRTNKGSSDG
jgi:uncharacterized protein YraI